MNDKIKTARHAVTVIGGDARQFYLARILAADGYDVSTYLIEKAIPGASRVGLTDIAKCGGVILPVRPEHDILEHIFGNDAPENGVVFAWNPYEGDLKLARSHGWDVCDLLTDERLTIKNALITAEATVKLFMDETETTVFGSKILVTGSGRVAKCVCRAFTSLGANVTMMARSKSELAWADASRWNAVDILDEQARIDAFSSEYDAIVNTIPQRVIYGRALEVIPKGTLLIDLASSPFGFDTDEARSLGLNAHRAQSLPGKYAPKAAAELIAEAVRCRLEGKGDTV